MSPRYSQVLKGQAYEFRAEIFLPSLLRSTITLKLRKYRHSC